MRMGKKNTKYTYWSFMTYKYNLDEFSQIISGSECKYCVFQLEYDCANNMTFINGYIVLNVGKSQDVTRYLLNDYIAYVVPAFGSPLNFKAMCTNLLYRVPTTEFVEFGSYMGLMGSNRHGSYDKSIPELFKIQRAVNPLYLNNMYIYGEFGVRVFL